MNIKKTVNIKNDTVNDLFVLLQLFFFFFFYCIANNRLFISVKNWWLSSPTRQIFKGYFHSILSTIPMDFMSN